MANPQIENGYTRIANETMDALAKIRIPGQARQVLDFILRKTYGWNKKTDMISLSQFVKGTGLSKVSVCKGINKLLDMGIITKKGNASSLFTKKGNEIATTYGFQKDFRLWRSLPKKVMLPKKVTLPKKVMYVTQKGNETLPKKVHTKDTITKDTITKDIIYIPIFKKWNEQKIIIHKKITPRIKSSINSALKEFSREEILQAFENYKTVLSGAEYYFTYKWTLEDFLKRGLRKFVDEADPFNNFKSDTRGNRKQNSADPNVSAGKYSETTARNIKSFKEWEPPP